MAFARLGFLHWTLFRATAHKKSLLPSNNAVLETNKIVVRDKTFNS